MNGEHQSGTEHKHISMELTADGAKVTSIAMEGTRLVLTIEAQLTDSCLVSRDAGQPPAHTAPRPRERGDTEFVPRSAAGRDAAPERAAPLSPGRDAGRPQEPPKAASLEGASPVSGSGQAGLGAAPVVQPRPAPLSVNPLPSSPGASLPFQNETDTWEVTPPAPAGAAEAPGKKAGVRGQESPRGITLGDAGGAWDAPESRPAGEQPEPTVELWNPAMPDDAASTAEGGGAVGGMRHGEPQPGISFGMGATPAGGISLGSPVPAPAPAMAPEPSFETEQGGAPGIAFDTTPLAPAPGLTLGDTPPMSPEPGFGGAPDIAFDTAPPAPAPGLSLGDAAPKAPAHAVGGIHGGAPGIALDTPAPAQAPRPGLGDSAPIAPGIAFDAPAPAQAPGPGLGDSAPISPGIALDAPAPAQAPGLSLGDSSPIAPGPGFGGIHGGAPGIALDTSAPAQAPGLSLGDLPPIGSGPGFGDVSGAGPGIGFDTPETAGPSPTLGFESQFGGQGADGPGFGGLALGGQPAPEPPSPKPERDAPTMPAFNQPAPAPQEKPQAPEKNEAGGTTVLIRYTCPKCKTQGMQAVDRVGTVVNCSNCGKAMRLVMKK